MTTALLLRRRLTMKPSFAAFSVLFVLGFAAEAWGGPAEEVAQSDGTSFTVFAACSPGWR